MSLARCIVLAHIFDHQCKILLLAISRPWTALLASAGHAYGCYEAVLVSTCWALAQYPGWPANFLQSNHLGLKASAKHSIFACYYMCDKACMPTPFATCFPSTLRGT